MQLIGIHTSSADLLLQTNEIASAELTSDLQTQRRGILCWVIVEPDSANKSEMVMNTWGRSCDKLLFMSSQNGKN